MTEARQGFLIFHLNLAFSAIAKADRPRVIEACYWPILRAARESDLFPGVECSGWTLEEIARLDPDWIAEFRALLEAGRCELIGSGYVQLIGPLVPYRVNWWNQKLGLDCYKEWLSTRPKLALVNEMAYASGLVGVYRQHGYRGLVMEWENVQLAHDSAAPSEGVWLADGLDGAKLPVLWSDSLLFQKFQRWVHREIAFEEYRGFLERRLRQGSGPLAVYCSDAEIFDFRPRRYAHESERIDGEWTRIRELLAFAAEKLDFVSPWTALAEMRKRETARKVRLNSVRFPAPVKKQPKYNLSRWAVTGRDDLRLNTLCHRLYQRIAADPQATPADWRELCALWSSDLRTHIRPERLRAANRRLSSMLRRFNEPERLAHSPESFPPVDPDALARHGVLMETDEENLELRVIVDAFRLTLNLRRGLTVRRLGFAEHHFHPIVGTLPHGYFEGIDLGADFYSGGMIVELPRALTRETDLARMTPEFGWDDGWCFIRGSLDLGPGKLVKTWRFRPGEQALWLRYDFPEWQRPFGIVRVGNVTLLPEAFAGELSLACHNGGETVERFTLDRDCDHAAAVSSLISCTTGLGAAAGALQIGDRARKLYLRWNPAECAAFPMLIHRPRRPGSLTRLVFSLAELDDTRKAGGALPSFELRLSPHLLDATAIHRG